MPGRVVWEGRTASRDLINSGEFRMWENEVILFIPGVLNDNQ